jgi:hypothetical protein
MAIVPEIPEPILAMYGAAFKAWYSAMLFATLVAQSPNHVLVRLQGLIDLRPIEAGCAGFYHRSGAGAKPKHSVRELVRILLVRYLYDLSLRETEAFVANNLLVRWFVGYGILEAVVDHSTLARFEQWVRNHQPRAYFDTILKQIKVAFPDIVDGTQVGDTFACRADAAAEGDVALLRHTSRLALSAQSQGDPQGHAAVLAGLDQQQLFGPADERNPYYLSEAERQQRKESTARGAWQLQQRLQPQVEHLEEPWKTSLGQRVADLRKILADDYVCQVDGNGQLTSVVERAAQHKGEYRLGSATDREATYRNHGQDVTLGYNISLSAHAKRGFICEIQAATGAEPDQAGVAELIRQQRDHLGLRPFKLIYDQAAGAGKTRAEVVRVSHGQTQLVARIPPASVSGRFTPDDFLVQEDGHLQCPAQRQADNAYRSNNRDGWIHQFKAKTCQDCPLWDQCREAGARLDGPRRVFISDYRAEIQQARAYNQTPAFQDDMRLRPRIERIIFMLTHYDGARRARSRGLQAVDFQVKMCATARNLRTWLIQLDQAMD